MSPRPPRTGVREDILDAAEGLLIGTGSDDAVSIRAVATCVGVTAPTIYRHFADKQHLLFEVCARHFARLADVVAESIARTADPVQALEAMGRAYVRFAVDNPEHYRIMFMGRPDLTPGEFGDEGMLETGAFATLVDTAQACIDAGRFRPDMGDAVLFAHALWATVHGVASIAVAKPNLPAPPLGERVDAALDLVLRGALVPSAG